MAQGGFLQGEGKKWLQMASEHSISSHYSTVCRLSELRASEEVAMFSVLVRWCLVSIGDSCKENMDMDWEKESWNPHSPTWGLCLCYSVTPLWLWLSKYCQCQKKKKSNLKQRRPTLLGNIERGCLSKVLTEPFMPMQTSHGLDRVPSTKHVNHLSVKKGEIRDWNLSRADPNTVLTASISQSVGERGSKILHQFFFSIQLSKGSDSSYISHWIDLCFQQSSPLLVCWLVERWQIGFHSLHGGAQWSGFDRVKRNSASMPPPSISLFLYAHTHTSLIHSLSFSFSFSLSLFPGA